MVWKTPKITEVHVGMEINMYACAKQKSGCTGLRVKGHVRVEGRYLRVRRWRWCSPVELQLPGMPRGLSRSNTAQHGKSRWLLALIVDFIGS